MAALLESLQGLQEIELQIVDIRRQLQAKQRSVTRQADKVRAAEAALASEREELRRSQVQQDELDLDLKAREANVTRLRDTLNTVRTNKEYAAVMSQLNNEKADKSRLESRAFELLETVESRKRAFTEHEEAVRQEARRLATLETQLAQAQASFADRLTALERQRDEASARLDGKSLDLFNRLSERYDGEVMARVIQVHPRRQEFLCDGCNMSLAAERANLLMTRDDLVTCDNCGRILYIDRTG
ncbi:MAG: C4-type zinc ribbon domain-containing protein [Planctomycetota bacterium]